MAPSKFLFTMETITSHKIPQPRSGFVTVEKADSTYDNAKVL